MPETYIRWRNEEWLRVAVNMLPRLEKGESNLVALANAMRKVIDKPRWQHDSWIAHTCQPKRALGLLKSWLDQARALPEAERLKLLVLTPAQRFAIENPDAPKVKRASPPPRKKLDEGREYKNHHRWTTLDKAKLARMICYFQDHDVKSPLSRMFIEAQELVLPADRRMSVRSIGVGTKRLPGYFAEGKQNLYLLKDVPFTPPLPPGSVQQDAQADEQAQASPETAQDATNAAQDVQTPPQATQAPLPAGSIREAMSAAAQAFGVTIMGALDTLLGQHTALVLSSIEARLSASAASHAAEVAAMVESGMRKAVSTMLAHELGGTLAAHDVAPAPAVPAKTPPPAPHYHHNPVPPSADRPEPLKVDVVGFELGSQETIVQQAFAGEVDLRFIHPDKASSFAPHRGRHVVMMVGRVPHSLSEKFKASKVEPIIVRRTPGHVIHAIEELQRARTGAAAH